MAKIKDVQIALEQALEDVVSSPVMRKLGEIAAERIRLRTRLGGSVSNDGGDKKPMKRLADSTIERRKESKKSGKLHGDTTPKKSNLTHTGQLLDSIKVIEPVGKASVKVGPNGGRDDGETNEKVAGYVSEGGRPFNHLSKVEIKALQRELQQELQSATQRRLTKLRK